MLEFFSTVDESIFFAINGLESKFLEALMPYYRHKLFWTPLYLVLMIGISKKFPINGLWIILFAVLCIGTSDTVSSKFIKKSVERLRPCNNIELRDQVKLRIRCGGGYSFTSSHATNHSALAFFIFFLLARPRRWWLWGLVVWAVSIGLAQVYVGVHYPLDVIAGFGLGGIIGALFSRIFGVLFTLH
ncbi:MAG: phosphatase PAP2 family protein [Saprospiraceae bacterium]|nr:phosphatase PAP2 family protein [Saprospiraceae bacterium]